MKNQGSSPKDVDVVYYVNKLIGVEVGRTPWGLAIRKRRLRTSRPVQSAQLERKSTTRFGENPKSMQINLNIKLSNSIKLGGYCNEFTTTWWTISASY